MGVPAPTADDDTSAVRSQVSMVGAGAASPGQRTADAGPNAGVPFGHGNGGGVPHTEVGARRGINIVLRDDPTSGPHAPPGEPALYELLRAGTCTAADLDALAATHPGYQLPITMLAAALRYAAGDLGETTMAQLHRIVYHSADPATHPFFSTHLTGASHVLIPVTPCLSVAMPFGRDAAALMLADAHHDQGRLDAAIDAVERITPGTHRAMMLARLYADAGRNAEVLRLTGALDNADDVGTLLLAYRGIALTRTGFVNAARAAFNAALARRDRAQVIRHFALRHRAELHAASARYAYARRDLERILAEDPAAADVEQRLTQLR